MRGFAMSDGRYDAALVCANGHVVTSMLKSSPSHTRNFCEECGAETMAECPKCHHTIPGSYIPSHVNLIYPYDPPKYCGNCGDAYPWTTRRIQALVETVQEFEEVGPEDAAKFRDNVADVVNDTPGTKPASARLKSLIGKMSS